ncbi:MAG: DUF5916 domain-containing protein, partial [Gemmatimonadales bacterium]
PMVALVLALLAPQQDGDPRPALAAHRARNPPVVDGVVDSLEWEDAAVATGFRQFLPRRGEPASRATVVRVLHDDVALYLAFEVFDDQPPTAQLTRRDASLLEDDAVVVLLDTHRDRQSAYYFITNLLGTQADGRVADDGRTVDASWDGRWHAAAQRAPYGWSVELAIPFSTLAFRPGKGRTWGINLGRSRRATLERSFWSGPLDELYRVSQAGELQGLDIPPPARRHQIIGYGLSRFQQDSTTQWDGGMDARYAIRQDVLVQGTLNPDFATVEADREQVNLTRFELSLPEKRPFFLEGSELFRQRIQTFYSRRIADIKAGAKLNAREGRWTAAMLWAAEESPSGLPDGHFLVARVRRDLFGRSNLGFTFADRLREGDHQGSGGLDATLFFSRTLSFTGQWIEAFGPEAAAPGGRGGRRAFFVRPSYDTPTSHFHVRYTHLGAGFGDLANAVGFIRDDDRRELDGALSRSFYFRRSVVERFGYDSNYNIYWSQSGPLRSWEVRQGIELDFRNRWSVEVRHIEDLQRFEADFRNRNTEIEIGYNTREFQSVSAGFGWGRNFGSAFRLWTVDAAWKPLPSLSLEYELERLTLDPDPEQETTWIHIVRVNQFFTPDLFLRLFVQTNSAIDRKNIQALLVWRYLPPFGTIQVAYQRGTAAFGTRSAQGHTLFLKATAVL